MKLLLIGMPGTGKTTFLAALWHVVDSGEIESLMKLTQLDADRDHLNKIRDDWISCRELDRTNITGERIVSMTLANTLNGSVASLQFPDLKGESFQGQLLERQWTRNYFDLVAESAGALLFIHPLGIKEPTRIDEANSVLGNLSEESVDADQGADATVPWDVSLMPTQVQLVELLQFHASHPTIHLPYRLAVVVSAWDVVRNEKTSPSEWLKIRLPLLYQYLVSNSGTYPHQIYGISAQGDKLENADALLGIDQPSVRIEVQGPDGTSHDLTAPIAWLAS